MERTRRHPTTALRRGRGKAQKNLDLIEAAHRILSEIQPASVRAVDYKLFNEKLITLQRHFD
jgi:hypothetical protein